PVDRPRPGEGVGEVHRPLGEEAQGVGGGEQRRHRLAGAHVGVDVLGATAVGGDHRAGRAGGGDGAGLGEVGDGQVEGLAVGVLDGQVLLEAGAGEALGEVAGGRGGGGAGGDVTTVDGAEAEVVLEVHGPLDHHRDGLPAAAGAD